MAEAERVQAEIRATVRALGDRAKQDAAFAQQLRADPRGALTAAGIPPALAQEILAATPQDEVAGYVRCEQSCWFTCIGGSWLIA